MNKKIFNTKILPQNDLYNHVNHTWIKNNKIPNNETRWGTFQILRKKNDKLLKKIVESIKINKSNEINKKISILYKQGLDTRKINKLGITPLQKYLKYIDNETDLTSIILYMHKMGVFPFFAPYDSSDKTNSDNTILYITQTGLGLPTNEYYFDEDKKDIQANYKLYIYNQLNNFKFNKNELDAMVKSIYNIEFNLAKNSLTPVESRDIQKSYNLVNIAKMNKLITKIDFARYIKGIGIKNVNKIEFNIHNIKYYSQLDKLLQNESLHNIKLYLKWKLINAFSKILSNKIETEQFNFYAKKLNGQQKKDPRWRTILDEVEGYLGEAIGRIYVDKYFNPQKKKIIHTMILNIKDVYKKRINNTGWLSDATKKKAISKLDNMRFKTVHPIKWKTYNKLYISNENTFVENIIECNKYYFEDNINKCYKKTDKDEWGMYPQTINAYYDLTKNEMVFPAGIFQDPFFNEKKMAESCGGIGAIIAHEITHGFDDQGSQFDKNGNLNNWWTPQDKTNFNKKAKQIIDQFNQYKFYGKKVNGSLTQGENIADLGGLTIAFHAFKKYMNDNNIISKNNKLEKQFFYNYSIIWREKITKKAIIKKINTDPHSPNELRVNAIITNMPEFYEVFDVKPIHKLYKPVKKRITIW